MTWYVVVSGDVGDPPDGVSRVFEDLAEAAVNARAAVEIYDRPHRVVRLVEEAVYGRTGADRRPG